MIVIGFFFWLHFWLRRRAKSAPRRYALQELDRLATDYRQDPQRRAFRRASIGVATAHDVGLRTAYRCRLLNRRSVVAVAGSSDLAQPVFANGPGRQLLELPYRDPASSVEVDDLDQLVAAIRHRVATPVGSKR